MDIQEKIAELELTGVHLWMEGDTLKYRSPKERITPETLNWLRNNKDAVIEHLSLGEQITHDDEGRFKAFDLTSMQKAYWIGKNADYELGGTGCHSYVELKESELDENRLERAWHQLIIRHDMLRAVILENRTQQVIADPIMPQLEVYDLRNLDEETANAEYRIIREKLAKMDYDIGSWPMHQFRLTKFKEYCILHFSIDMMIGDFISVNIMYGELMQLYHNPKVALPVLDVTFRDLVMAEIKQKNTSTYQEKLQRAKRYWAEKIPTMGKGPELPVKHRDVRTVEFERSTFRLSKQKWSVVKQIAQEDQLTTSVIVMTMYIEVLNRWAANDEFCINLTLMDRAEGTSSNVVGDFTSVSVFATDRLGSSFLEKASLNQTKLIHDMEHNSYSGIDVLRDIGRDKGENLIIPIVYTSALGAANVQNEMEMIYGVSRTPQVWIDCQVMDSSGDLVVNWDVRRGIFRTESINEMFNVFTRSLEALSEKKENWSATDSLVFTQNQWEIRNKVNNTNADLGEYMLYDGFLHHLTNTPDAIAVISERVSYTYSDIGKYTRSIMDSLKESAIVSRDAVSIMVSRGVWQVAAVLGVLLSGAVYVPIDAKQPVARQEKIVRSSNIKCIICNDKSATVPVEDVPYVFTENLQPALTHELLPGGAEPGNPAYVIYTSGSTGLPKGVAITHKAAMNTIKDINSRFSVTDKDRILGISNLSFDLSVYDLFGAFDAGACLVLPSIGQERDPGHWMNLYNQYDITMWNSVPALITMFLETVGKSKETLKDSMRMILLSGDLIHRALPQQIKAIFPNTEIYSLGGATEASIWSIHYPITNYTEDANIPYGLPLTNQEFYILNKNANICPDWVLGEIHIAGKGLAVGYYGDEELTSQKFIYSELFGKTLYKTGDLGCYRPDGVIEFHGRIDSQVKINGHRIELGEIETALELHPYIAKAAATVYTSEHVKKSLAAFVIPKASEGIEQSIIDLSDRLSCICAETGEKSIDKVGRDKLLRWKKCSDEAAIADMLWFFQSLNIFMDKNQQLTSPDIINLVKPKKDYERSIQRWLNVLVKENVISRDESGTYRLMDSGDQRKSRESCWKAFKTIENEIKYSKILFEYQKDSSGNLLQQIRGEVNALDLFFPQGETNIAMAAYNNNLVNSALNQVVKESILEIVSDKYKKYSRPVRILEVGAGVGGTTQILVPEMHEEQVKYHFTDVSNFFLNKARETYADYPFMSYGIYDINQDYREQGFASSSYDIILCANVLHNAKNGLETLKVLKELLRPNGAFVIIDAIAESYSLLTSLELKGGLNNFTDVRENRKQTFFTNDDWNVMLPAAGLYNAASFPKNNDPLLEIGQRVFVNFANTETTEVDEEEIRLFLNNHLMPYMVPAQIKLLYSLPLNANGKVDRKKLFILSETVAGDKENQSMEQSLTDLEEKILNIWKEVLGVEALAKNENFYVAGGDSLLIAQVVTKMKDQVTEIDNYSWDNLMQDILKYPTVEGICSIINQGDKTTADLDIIPDGSKDDKCMHIYQNSKTTGANVKAFFHAGTGRLRDYMKLMPLLQETVTDKTIVGFTYGDDRAYTGLTVEELIYKRAQIYADHLMKFEAERYELVGYCVGGFVAMETARILIDRGCNVAPVVTISSHLCLHKIENELLMECAYGSILGTDMYRAGYRGNVLSIRKALEHILQGENRDVTNDELCALSGEFAEIGEAFTQLCNMSHDERMRNIYNNIVDMDFNGEESSISMLNLLYRIFNHTYKAMIRYRPEFFSGDVVALIPDEQLMNFYPVMEADIPWEEFVLGSLHAPIIRGDHDSCISTDYMVDILPFIQ